VRGTKREPPPSRVSTRRLAPSEGEDLADAYIRSESEGNSESSGWNLLRAVIRKPRSRVSTARIPTISQRCQAMLSSVSRSRVRDHRITLANCLVQFGAVRLTGLQIRPDTSNWFGRFSRYSRDQTRTDSVAKATATGS